MVRSVLFCLSAALFTLQAAPPAEELTYVVVMSRHGIRSSLWTAEQANSYSAQPWPTWDVPIGYLTEHGRVGMQLMGAYYRQYFAEQKLLPAAPGCADAEKFYFWSDTDERDIETGKAIASRLFGNCPAVMHRVPDETPDPLFRPVRAGLGKNDFKKASAALLASIGVSPEALLARYRPQLELLEKILLGCEPERTCSAAQTAGKRSVLTDPFAIIPEPTLMADLMGPLKAASSMADSILLEYADDMKPQDVGWGRVTRTNLRELLLLQEAYVSLVLRTPYLAQATGSNLMSHILNSLQQATGRTAVPGSLGQPGDKGLIILGHDSNESNLEGLLGTSWTVEGFQPNCRPPGSSLIFELWRNAATGKYSVHSWFVTQTLEQMRNNVPLSLARPPVRVPLTIAGCGGPSCDWDQFRKAVGAAILPEFVSNAPLPEAQVAR